MTWAHCDMQSSCWPPLWCGKCDRHHVISSTSIPAVETRKPHGDFLFYAAVPGPMSLPREKAFGVGICCDPSAESYHPQNKAPTRSWNRIWFPNDASHPLWSGSAHSGPRYQQRPASCPLRSPVPSHYHGSARVSWSGESPVLSPMDSLSISYRYHFHLQLTGNPSLHFLNHNFFENRDFIFLASSVEYGTQMSFALILLYSTMIYQQVAGKHQVRHGSPSTRWMDNGWMGGWMNELALTPRSENHIFITMIIPITIIVTHNYNYNHAKKATGCTTVFCEHAVPLF